MQPMAAATAIHQSAASIVAGLVVLAALTKVAVNVARRRSQIMARVRGTHLR
jgi:hypothetical protein